MILIVDDDHASAGVIQAILDAAFYTPTVTAADSALAWPLLQTGAGRLLILDGRWPTVRGPAFYATVQHPLPVVPPVFFLTAGPDRLAAYEVPATPVLAKPFTLDALIAAVTAAWPDVPPRRAAAPLSSCAN